jgi:hypothetical protein
MSKTVRISFLLFAMSMVLSATSCASTGQNRHIDQTLSICKQLIGPDAGKAEGELWFWLQSERAKASRKLWSMRGVKAIDARLAATTDELDRACLVRLRKEAETHQLVRD